MNSKEMKIELRSALYGYRKMNVSVERKLRNLGFDICRTNRHIILRTIINGRMLQFTLGSTISDNRSCKNLVSDICRTIRISYEEQE